MFRIPPDWRFRSASFVTLNLVATENVLPLARTLEPPSDDRFVVAVYVGSVPKRASEFVRAIEDLRTLRIFINLAVRAAHLPSSRSVSIMI